MAMNAQRAPYYSREMKKKLTSTQHYACSFGHFGRIEFTLIESNSGYFETVLVFIDLAKRETQSDKDIKEEKDIKRKISASAVHFNDLGALDV